jgi:hypothetical protein
VLSNEYGDCKDKHTLLAALLKAAGIEAWPVLISSGRELDPSTPSPAQFDHVITLVPLGGKLVWMDSTEEVAPVGVLLATLRDKQALAVPDGKAAYLEHTPVDLPAPRTVRIQVEGKLSDQGLFIGHIAQSVDGDVGILYRAAFRRVPQSKWKESLQGVARFEGFAGEISNPQVSDVEQISQPFSFSFDYTREKYYQWDDHDTSHWISAPLPAMGGELAPGVKEKKPGDDPELGYTGETIYHAVLQLPAGWSMVPPKDVDLNEDWLEYHAKYGFKDGTFTAERTANVKKTKVPLDQWEKYLAFRRGMFDDWNRQTLISPTESQIGGARFSGDFHSELVQRKDSPATAKAMQQLLESVQRLRDAATVLEADIPASADELVETASHARKAVDDIEATTLTLFPNDPQSLASAQLLGLAWGTLGWASFEAKDLSTAETYLRAAWLLSQEQIWGYQLGRLLEVKGEKAAAAHQYELAFVSNGGISSVSILSPRYDTREHVRESYLWMTGKALTATALNNGQYNGSLRAELDKQIEIHGFTPNSKYTGEALFSVTYEAGKPHQVHFLGGERKLAPMVSILDGHRFAVSLPTGSKARLLREVRLICSSYGGGCDAYMLLPTAIQLPSQTIPTQIDPGNAPKGREDSHNPASAPTKAGRPEGWHAVNLLTSPVPLP